MTLKCFPLCLVAAMLCMQPALPQAGPPATPRDQAIADARQKLSVAESAHPGNTVEVAAALDALVEEQLEGEGATEETPQPLNS